MVFDAMRASQTLFRNMLLRIMKATPRFFDITPLGRIISRLVLRITIPENSLKSHFLHSSNIGVSRFPLPVAVVVYVILSKEHKHYLSLGSVMTSQV